MRIVYQCPDVTVDIWERIEDDGESITLALDFDKAVHRILNRTKPTAIQPTDTKDGGIGGR